MNELELMRANLAATQARCTQILDAQRNLRYEVQRIAVSLIRGTMTDPIAVLSMLREALAKHTLPPYDP